LHRNNSFGVLFSHEPLWVKIYVTVTATAWGFAASFAAKYFLAFWLRTLAVAELGL